MVLRVPAVLAVAVTAQLQAGPLAPTVLLTLAAVAVVVALVLQAQQPGDLALLLLATLVRKGLLVER